MFLIFADLGDGSGNNVSMTKLYGLESTYMFKFIILTGMGVLNVYFRTKKELFKKLMYFFIFTAIFCMFLEQRTLISVSSSKMSRK